MKYGVLEIGSTCMKMALSIVYSTVDTENCDLAAYPTKLLPGNHDHVLEKYRIIPI